MATLLSKKGEKMEYSEFIERKQQSGSEYGFESVFIPDWMFDFQKSLVAWATKKGRSAIFADCGLGKTPMQLVWAENVIRKTNKPVLILTPLAVSYQTAREADKFGIKAEVSRDGKKKNGWNVVITNYERIHYFKPDWFSGIVCDESSAIKSFKSKRKADITEFMRTIPYRLLCTATPSPNDFFELGTSSEALGELGFQDMLSKFFRQENKKDHLGWGRVKYRFRGHAQEPFWRWVCSWARSCRRPSDLGFENGNFELPELKEEEIRIEHNKTRPGELFSLPARNMEEQRIERRVTLNERSERAAEEISKHKGSSIAWCHLNSEADLVERLVPEAKQVSGSMPDELKEERLLAFATGELKVLVTKPKIGCWGMNYQNCHHQVMFPSDSFEQYYQSVRRSWRFGQTKPVQIKIITTEGGRGVLENLQRKSKQCDAMFESLNRYMNDQLKIESKLDFAKKGDLPKWM